MERLPAVRALALEALRLGEPCVGVVSLERKGAAASALCISCPEAPTPGSREKTRSKACWVFLRDGDQPFSATDRGVLEAAAQLAGAAQFTVSALTAPDTTQSLKRALQEQQGLVHEEQAVANAVGSLWRSCEATGAGANVRADGRHVLSGLLPDVVATLLGAARNGPGDAMHGDEDGTNARTKTQFEIGCALFGGFCGDPSAQRAQLPPAVDTTVTIDKRSSTGKANQRRKPARAHVTKHGVQQAQQAQLETEPELASRTRRERRPCRLGTQLWFPLRRLDGSVLSVVLLEKRPLRSLAGALADQTHAPAGLQGLLWTAQEEALVERFCSSAATSLEVLEVRVGVYIHYHLAATWTS